MTRCQYFHVTSWRPTTSGPSFRRSSHTKLCFFTITRLWSLSQVIVICLAVLPAFREKRALPDVWSTMLIYYFTTVLRLTNSVPIRHNLKSIRLQNLCVTCAVWLLLSSYVASRLQLLVYTKYIIYMHLSSHDETSYHFQILRFLPPPPFIQANTYASPPSHLIKRRCEGCIHWYPIGWIHT